MPALRTLCFLLLTSLAARAQKAAGARGLMLQERSLPGAVFVWQALRELEEMPADAMMAAAQEFQDARLRGAAASDAERLLLISWVERAPAEALKWSHGAITRAASDPWREEGLSGFLPLLAELWCRVEAQDEKSALALLVAMPPTDAGVLYRRRVAWLWKPKLARLPVFLQGITTGVSHAGSAQNMVDAILWAAVQAHGWKPTSRAVESLKPRALRITARARMEHLRDEPPAPPGKALPEPAMQEKELRAFFVLNHDSSLAPLALRRAVCSLSTEAAGAMRARVVAAGMAPDAPAAWMLAMHASEGSTPLPPEAASDTMLAGVRVQQTAAALWSRRAAPEAAALVQMLREQKSPAVRRDTLSGYLLSEEGQRTIRGQLGSPVMAFAGEIQLPSADWRAPLLAATGAGAGPAALSFARSIPGESTASLRQLRIELLSLLALMNAPAFLQDATSLSTPDELSRAWAAAAPWLTVDQVLSAPADLLAALPGAWWESLALTAPDRGFALLESPNRTDAEALAAFAAGAVQKEPERAFALLQRAAVPFDKWPLDRLLHWHPDKVKTLTASLTVTDWEPHTRRLLRRFPVRAPALLRQVPAPVSQ